MATFYRGQFSEVWFNLQSNEALGLLDSGYIEDYNGIDGQLTIRNKGNDSTITLLITALPDVTQSINNDVFTGYIDLSLIPNGNYQLEGRIRDIVGNYTILSDFATPLGTERVIQYNFSIVDGIESREAIEFEGLRIIGSLELDMEVSLTDITTEFIVDVGVDQQMDSFSIGMEIHGKMD